MSCFVGCVQFIIAGALGIASNRKNRCMVCQIVHISYLLVVTVGILVHCAVATLQVMYLAYFPASEISTLSHYLVKC